MEDYVGQRFGRLIILSEGERKSNRKTFVCQCDCGNIKTIEQYSILGRKEKSTRSCGCINMEVNTKHGMSGGNKHKKESRFYDIYNGIKVRCNNKNACNYKYYGGRGILYLRNDFNHFKEDMLESYEEHVRLYGEKETTIDRINVNDHYCKENCKWSTRKEQRINQQKKCLNK